jgi:hypothetical protein
MSFSKQTLLHFTKSLNAISDQTQNDNDITAILMHLNALMDIAEDFSAKAPDLAFYWNEIISDVIGIINAGLSGQYRLAMGGLRGVLELGSSAFFYYDHKIELQLFINERLKADTYVSMLVSDYFFFKTAYVRVFKPDIDSIQSGTDSVANFLRETYSKLCDVVHGRHGTLTKLERLEINYSKPIFKKFESLLFDTLSCVALMYVLRFNKFDNLPITRLAHHSKALI